ncbi:hypothetical protein AB0K08_16310 [Citricoccus sp. NPDC055426]|uniref:hypothetical protein n=1 Tax=Citricoccus sp. NPDC055426 TaxID=3155536 RepID=UPI0034160A34
MRRTWSLPLIIAVAAVLLGAGLALAFTQPLANDDPVPTTTPASPRPSTPTETDAAISARQEAAVEAARLMTTWNPARDLNRTAAELRARHLMTEARAEQVIAPERPATGTEWLEAAERDATSVPTIELNKATELTEDGVSITATWTWDSPDGGDIPEEQGTQPRIYYFEFTEDNEIHDYSY